MGCGSSSEVTRPFRLDGVEAARRPSAVEAGPAGERRRASADVGGRDGAARAVGTSPRDHVAETYFAEELSVALGPRRANGWLASTREVGACRCTPTLARGPRVSDCLSVSDCLRQLQEERQASLAIDTDWQQNEGVDEYSEGDAPALAPPDNVVDSFFVEQLTATLGPRSASGWLASTRGGDSGPASPSKSQLNGRSSAKPASTREADTPETASTRRASREIEIASRGEEDIDISSLAPHRTWLLFTDAAHLAAAAAPKLFVHSAAELRPPPASSNKLRLTHRKTAPV
jgi:hypothetical protein